MKEEIKILVNQYQLLIRSNNKLMEMALSKKSSKIWLNNYHLIDSNYLNKWKDKICFDELIEQEFQDNEQNIYEFIEKNINPIEIGKLNNKTIYYAFKNRKQIDPMKSFDLISDELWKLFDINNENSIYNGEVSILKGIGKIIIKFDENNYSVRYLRAGKKFGEFIILFNPPENDYKGTILEEISNCNIFTWMGKVHFKLNEQHFTIDNYEIPFEIKQKTNNDLYSSISLDVSNESSNKSNKYISTSKTNFSTTPSFIPKNSSFSNSSNFSSFLSDINNYSYIEKYKKTTNICSVMRCLSMIESFSDYFMSVIKHYKIFSQFDSNSLLNLIRDYFLNLWSFDNKAFSIEDFFISLEKLAKIDINEEKHPIYFLKFILEYINKCLNECDININLDIIDLKKESYFSDLNNIIKNNNTIVGQNFLGILLETYKCKCNQKIEKIKEFKILEIDYIPVVEIYNQLGNSFTILTLDEFLEHYFLRKNILECNKCGKECDIIYEPNIHIYCSSCNKKTDMKYSLSFETCPKCKKKARIVKRDFIKYPPYLIIRLDRGKYETIKEWNKPINFEKIEDLKNYYFLKEYEDQCEYKLISKIILENSNEIKYKSICKSPFEFNKKEQWISFDCGISPKKYKNIKLKKKEDFDEDEISSILFYQLDKKHINYNKK